MDEILKEILAELRGIRRLLANQSAPEIECRGGSADEIVANLKKIAREQARAEKIGRRS